MRRGRHRIRTRARGQRRHTEHQQRAERRQLTRGLPEVLDKALARAQLVPERLHAWRSRLTGDGATEP